MCALVHSDLQGAAIEAEPAGLVLRYYNAGSDVLIRKGQPESDPEGELWVFGGVCIRRDAAGYVGRASLEKGAVSYRLSLAKLTKSADAGPAPSLTVLLVRSHQGRVVQYMARANTVVTMPVCKSDTIIACIGTSTFRNEPLGGLNDGTKDPHHGMIIANVSMRNWEDVGALVTGGHGECAIWQRIAQRRHSLDGNGVHDDSSLRRDRAWTEPTVLVSRPSMTIFTRLAIEENYFTHRKRAEDSSAIDEDDSNDGSFVLPYSDDDVFASTIQSFELDDNDDCYESDLAVPQGGKMDSSAGSLDISGLDDNVEPSLLAVHTGDPATECDGSSCEQKGSIEAVPMPLEGPKGDSLHRRTIRVLYDSMVAYFALKDPTVRLARTHSGLKRAPPVEMEQQPLQDAFEKTSLEAPCPSTVVRSPPKARESRPPHAAADIELMPQGLFIRLGHFRAVVVRLTADIVFDGEMDEEDFALVSSWSQQDSYRPFVVAPRDLVAISEGPPGERLSRDSLYRAALEYALSGETPQRHPSHAGEIFILSIEE